MHVRFFKKKKLQPDNKVCKSVLMLPHFTFRLRAIQWCSSWFGLVWFGAHPIPSDVHCVSVGFLCVLQFPPTSQKHTDQWTGYTKLSLAVWYPVVDWCHVQGAFLPQA